MEKLELKTAEKLRAAKALIADPKDWCRFESVNSKGQYCARGAAEAIDAYDRKLHRLLEAASFELYQTKAVAEEVNDRLGHLAIMAVYDRAIELAEKATP